ncbi:hypothetical protein IWW57_005765 [Coemansia sp. S610]|nr:hypothetical protein LPJ60_003840 [Coemansia sp. RSA 2675]KAJ2014980.1 hypothetical protein IWW57_005765 [Coemansia sp. S610]
MAKNVSLRKGAPADKRRRWMPNDRLRSSNVTAKTVGKANSACSRIPVPRVRFIAKSAPVLTAWWDHYSVTCASDACSVMLSVGADLAGSSGSASTQGCIDEGYNSHASVDDGLTAELARVVAVPNSGDDSPTAPLTEDLVDVGKGRGSAIARLEWMVSFGDSAWQALVDGAMTNEDAEEQGPSESTDNTIDKEQPGFPERAIESTGSSAGIVQSVSTASTTTPSHNEVSQSSVCPPVALPIASHTDGCKASDDEAPRQPSPAPRATASDKGKGKAAEMSSLDSPDGCITIGDILVLFEKMTTKSQDRFFTYAFADVKVKLAKPNNRTEALMFYCLRRFCRLSLKDHEIFTEVAMDASRVRSETPKVEPAEVK